MRTRLLALEVRALARSRVVWLAVLLAVGGSAVARAASWAAHALGRTELSGLLGFSGAASWSDVAVPLALLAYLILTAYLFGRDFEDGSIDLLLTAPVGRDVLVTVRGSVLAGFAIALALLGWAADVATCALLAGSPFDPGAPVTLAAALGSGLAAIATLPVVAWASVRFRAVLPALGLGIAVQTAAILLGRIWFVRLLPWSLPGTLASTGPVSVWTIAASLALFLAGVLATVQALRTVDLVD